MSPLDHEGPSRTHPRLGSGRFVPEPAPRCHERVHQTDLSKAPSAIVLIRLMIGAVFLSEGIQKFLFPADVGAGRFEKIGLPSPEILGPARWLF